MALVMGFGGMRQHDDSLSFSPRLPNGLNRLSFTVTTKGTRLRVEVLPKEANYQVLEDGDTLEIAHHGENIVVEPGHVATYKIPELEPRESPQQPVGRAPAKRHK